MSNVALVVDSTCDLGVEKLKSMNVAMVPLKVTFGEETYLDAIEISPQQFYERLDQVDYLPKTSMPSPAEFLEVFNDLSTEGYDEIVSVSISSGISGTYGGSVLAAKDVSVPVYCIDTKCVTLGLGLLVDAAAKLRDRGFSAAEIAERIEEISQKTVLLFIIDNLDNLVKGGRAHKAAGLASTLLDIKPILTLDDEGKIVPFKKFKGKGKALAGLAKYVKSQSDEHGRLNYACIYTQEREDIELLRTALSEVGVIGEELVTASNGPVIGTYVPQACGIAYYPAELLDRE